MSIETWKKKFWTEPSEFVDQDDTASLASSLRKWVGLRASNLKRHGLYLKDGSYNSILSNYKDATELLVLGRNNCSPCALHYDPYERRPCRGCPLFEVHQRPCFDAAGLPNSPYDGYRRTGDSAPMIKLIREAIKRDEATHN